MNIKQIQKMMQQAQTLQKKMEEELGRLSIEGTSGGGMVTVVMDGHKNVKSFTIRKEAVDPDDVELLQDLLVAACHDAARQVDKAVQSQLSGLIPPGMARGM